MNLTLYASQAALQLAMLSRAGMAPCSPCVHKHMCLATTTGNTSNDTSTSECVDEHTLKHSTTQNAQLSSVSLNFHHIGAYAKVKLLAMDYQQPASCTPSFCHVLAGHLAGHQKPPNKKSNT